MNLAYLIYRLANDDRLIGQLQEWPQETLADLQLSLEQATIDAVLAEFYSILSTTMDYVTVL